MGSYVQGEDEVPVYGSGAEVLQKLQEKWKSPVAAPYPAMYSSVAGGIILDPAMMAIPIDDHMVHRGQGVFDTAMLLDGHLYELDPHLDRFLRSAAQAKVGTPFPRDTLRSIMVQMTAASGCRKGSIRYWLSSGPGDFLLSSSGCPSPAFYAVVIPSDYSQCRHGIRAVTTSVRAHEAPAVRHHEECQLPLQRALHHGRRGARRVRVRMGGRTRARRRGTHGEHRLRDPGRRARAPGLRQDPQRVHRQAAAHACPEAGRRRTAQGRQHREHHRRRGQEIRRDGLRRQRPARAAHRRVGRATYRRREGGEADACAVGFALGGHEVRAGQDRGSLQVIGPELEVNVWVPYVYKIVRELSRATPVPFACHLSKWLPSIKSCSITLLCVKNGLTEAMNNEFVSFLVLIGTKILSQFEVHNQFNNSLSISRDAGPSRCFKPTAATASSTALQQATTRPPLLHQRSQLPTKSLGFPHPPRKPPTPTHPTRPEPPPAAMSTAAAQGGEKPALRKPVFVKVDQLEPGTNGHTLTVKVVKADPVAGRARPGAPASSSRAPRIAECLVGDETGAIVFTARNEQVDVLKPGATAILRNAKIDMFKGSMRLAVDKWGRVEATEPASFTVNQENNLSQVEYELVNVAE